MSLNFFSTARIDVVKRGRAALIIMLAVTILRPAAMADPLPVNLGTDTSFAVLAGSGITVTGPTTITGAIGTFPTPAITGLANVTLNGANNADNAVTQQAQLDLTTAYNDAAGRTPGTNYGGGFDLVGLTLTSGVYSDASSLFLSGSLTLDAQGNPDAVWVFQIGSTLITASDSMVNLIGGAQACHVFWQVGSSATLGTDTFFVGNILALTDITLTTGATVDGRLLARNGAVTLDTNTITMAVCNTGSSGGGSSGGVSTVPEKGSTLLMLASAVLGLVLLRRRFVM